ncbi:hypothetical protein ACFC1T_33135 [Kitasatospora sp. NPDC056076]|uniref:hypothetical protein n=1 Tax=Kitasatospora sp. NPDC056076 TaxID=3345703 RepID=UPI0035DBCBF9
MLSASLSTLRTGWTLGAALAAGLADGVADGGTGEGVGEETEAPGAPGTSVASTSVTPSGAATPLLPQGLLQAAAPPSNDIPAATISSLREVTRAVTEEVI